MHSIHEKDAFYEHYLVFFAVLAFAIDIHIWSTE